MERGFLPRLLSDVDSENFLLLLIHEVGNTNPLLAKFVIKKTGEVKEETEKERTLLAALIGLKILGASNKSDPDYVEVTKKSIEEAQQQTCNSDTLGKIHSEGIFWAKEKISGVNCGLNDLYGRKKKTIGTFNVLHNVCVFFRAYEIEMQKVRGK